MPHLDLCSQFYVCYFQTNLPVFRVKESSVRRRFSDFEWLRNELERDSKVSLNFDKSFKQAHILNL